MSKEIMGAAKSHKLSNVPKVDISGIKASLRTRIKLYKNRAKETEDYLSKYPNEWGKFQKENYGVRPRN
jgi:hypothetical protein